MINVQKVSNPSNLGGSSSFSKARNGIFLMGMEKDLNHMVLPIDPKTHNTTKITTHHIISPFICFSSDDRLYRGPLLFSIAFVSWPNKKNATRFDHRELTLSYESASLLRSSNIPQLINVEFNRDNRDDSIVKFHHCQLSSSLGQKMHTQTTFIYFVRN